METFIIRFMRPVTRGHRGALAQNDGRHEATATAHPPNNIKFYHREYLLFIVYTVANHRFTPHRGNFIHNRPSIKPLF